MVRFGPEVQASYVVLFKDDATDQQIFEFVTNVLSTPDPRGGHAHMPGLGSLLKVEVDGYDGYALQFQSEAKEGEIAAIKKRVKFSPIVFRTYEDLAPDQINVAGPQSN